MTWDEIKKIKSKIKQTINLYIKTDEVFLEPSGNITFYTQSNCHYLALHQLSKHLDTTNIKFALCGKEVCFVIVGARLGLFLD